MTTHKQHQKQALQYVLHNFASTSLTMCYVVSSVNNLTFHAQARKKKQKFSSFVKLFCKQKKNKNKKKKEGKSLIKKRKASVSNRNEGKKKDCYQVHTPFLFLIKLCLPVDVVRRRKEEKKKKISTVTLLVAMVMIYFEIFSELRSFISGKGTKKNLPCCCFL